MIFHLMKTPLVQLLLYRFHAFFAREFCASVANRASAARTWSENAVRSCTGLPQLLDALTTVRYPRARMRRLAMDAVLGYAAETVPALPPYLHLLGARREVLPLLKHASLPLSHSLAKLEKENDACARMAAAQAAASDFGALCRRVPGPMGGVYRQKIIFLTN